MAGKPLPALVTDAHTRSVVAGLRGLGRAGIDVTAVVPSRWAAGARSRLARRSVLAPSVRKDPPGFLARVLELARAGAPIVLYPGIEDSLEAMIGAWDDLPDGARLPYPGPRPLEILRDKRALRERAGGAGFPLLDTYAAGSAGELAPAELPLPCVVKGAAPVGNMPLVHVIETRAELEALLASLPPEEPLLVQERAPGPLLALSLVLDREGRPVARFQQEARRSWPASAGPSSLALGVAPDEELVGRTAQMLASAGFWGMAQVQFMGTSRGPAPIDVNPRFYGSLPLALASGVNLPAIWHAVASGEDPGRTPEYRPGIVYRWLEADISAALQGRPGRLRARAARPRAGAMWSADDPLASLLLAADAVTGRLGRLVRR